MVDAFSGHLANSYQANGPLNSSIVTHESMSFNPAMHSTPLAQQSFSLFGSQPSLADVSEETAKKIASLQAKLNQKLGPEFISQRPGPGGGSKLTYAEGWKIINLANEVFGFNGWSSSIVSLNTDFIDFIEASGKYNVGVTAIVRVTLRDGTFHEDVGYGLMDNGKQKGAALDKSKKEAVTDAIKRALRNFGNVLGNCLYDKSYTSEVVKMKIPLVKLRKEELHRLPEFDDVKVDVASVSASSSSIRPVYPHQQQANATPTRQPMQQNQTKPLSSIPVHVRSEISGLGSTSISSASHAIQADIKRPVHPTGLNTPITPRHHPPQRPNLNPPQHQYQLVCRVSADHQQALTTKPPSAATMNPEPKRSPTDFEADESFGFNSDDDALFALADLGPPIDADCADAGRPISSDEGRPLNYDGLLGGGSAGDTIIGDHALDQHHQKKTEPPGVGVVSAPQLSRRELIAAALVSVEDKADITSDSDSLKGHGYGDERQASESGNFSNETTSGTGAGTSNAHGKMLLQAAGTNTSSSTSALGVRSSIPPQQRQQNQNNNPGLNLTSLVQQRYQRHMAQRQNQNENLNQMGLLSSSSESKRASTPSIGGFHFPPGINPQINLTTSNSASTSSSSGIGSKRPAEAMTSNTIHTYRTSGGCPGIGMGLQQSIPGPGVSTATREILGRLEVGEGGDVKRMRR